MSRAVALIVVLAITGCTAVVPSSPTSPSSPLATTSPAGTLAPTLPATPTPEPTPADLSARPLIWFAPLPPLPMGPGRQYTGSDDFLDLFTADARWTNAAGRIGVFKLYGEWVDYTDGASLGSAVRGIGDRGIVLAVEAGPLDAAATCGAGVEGFAGRESGLRLARTIRAAGGVLQVIALDEPWYFAHVYDGPNACHWPVEQVAEGVAAFVAAVREEFPWVQVGDIEPAPPPVSAAGLAAWIDAYTAAVGAPPAFLHLDVDWARSDWPAQALAVETASRQRGVPFGLIYNGGSATSDATWAYRAGTRVVAYEDVAGGRPDHVVFQSWMDKPDAVLPETEPSSFTALINRYVDDRAALDDPPPGTEVNLALGRPATASSATGDAPAASAVDGDADTIWNAGAGPPAWIEIDLGSAVAIGEVRLVVSQFPAGATTHLVKGRTTAAGPAIVLATLDGATSDNDRLVATVDAAAPAIRYLRIETVTSPSWVAWREIEVTPRGQ